MIELGDAQLEAPTLGIVFRNVSGVGVVPSLMCCIVLVTVVRLFSFNWQLKVVPDLGCTSLYQCMYMRKTQ